jgi:alanyl-tRNA synthetase
MLARFEASILAVEDLGEAGFGVVLDQTAFYPEAGGQPADEGILGEAEVFDVQVLGDRILHMTDQPPEAGERVEGSLDWPRRWDHMQQHTGQHLLSAIIMTEFGAETRGFHLGSEDSTIDISMNLDESQLLLAESRANELIDADHAVIAEILDRTDPALSKARKPPPEVDRVRLVQIEGVDAVPCGGTHVPSTSRIGGFHILAAGRGRAHGMQRITFVCGGRLIRKYAELDRVTSELSRLLTTGPEQFVERFEILQEENGDLLREVGDLREAVVPMRAATLIESAETVGSARIVVARIDDLPPESLLSLADSLTSEPDVIALLGAEISGAGRLIFARGDGTDADMGALLGEAARLLGGGGGGAPDHASGGGPQGEALDMALTTSLESLRQQL